MTWSRRTARAHIDWYAPRQVWEPIHARVDVSSGWYDRELERAKDIVRRYPNQSVKNEYAIHGLIAEGVVLNVFPHLERFDGRDTDLNGYGKVFDVVAGHIRGPPSPHYEIIVANKSGHEDAPPRRAKATPGLCYYACRYNHPNYWLIGYTESIRFWHLATSEPNGHMAQESFHGDGDASLSFEHFRQLPIPDSFDHVIPAIDVFGQG